MEPTLAIGSEFSKRIPRLGFSSLQNEFKTTTQDILLLVHSLDEHDLYGVS